jgi:large subunit ribosomal protein L26e
MPISPHSPRRQRKAHFTADTFHRRLRMTVPLSRELRRRFHRRAVPVRKGDTVRVLSGSYEGREERVARVLRRNYTLVLDNVTLKSGEEKLKPLPIQTNHLVITRLNLADAWRRRALQVADEDVTAEERGEAPEEPEPEAATAALPEPAADAPAESEPAPEPEAPPKTARRGAKKAQDDDAEEGEDA